MWSINHQFVSLLCSSLNTGIPFKRSWNQKIFPRRMPWGFFYPLFRAWRRLQKKRSFSYWGRKVMKQYCELVTQPILLCVSMLSVHIHWGRMPPCKFVGQDVHWQCLLLFGMNRKPKHCCFYNDEYLHYIRGKTHEQLPLGDCFKLFSNADGIIG